MKTNHEIALKAAVDYLKFKLGDRKGFNVYDIDASDADELITEIEQECAKSFMDFLAAVDAERGKDAVGYDAIFNAIAMSVRSKGGLSISVKAFKDALGGEIFLSPTIPEGMALVPIEPTQEMCEQAYYEFNTEQKDFDAANLYRAMIQAAGVTK